MPVMLRKVRDVLGEPATAAGLVAYHEEHLRRASARQLLIAMGALAHGLLYAWWSALVIALALGLAEAMEHRASRRVLRRPPGPGDAAALERRTLLRAGLYGAAVAAAIGLIWYQGSRQAVGGGEASHFMAMIVAIAAAFEAGFQFPGAERPAALKVAASALAVVGGFAVGLAFGGPVDTSFWVEVFGVLILLYVAHAIIRDVVAHRLERGAAMAELAERGAALERALEELRLKEGAVRRLALAAEYVGDSIVITDASDRIEWVNHGFTARTGLSLADVRDRPGRLAADPANDPATLKALHRAIDRRLSFRSRLRLWCRGDRWVWYDVSLTPLFDDEGRFVNYVSVERDVSEEVAREAELARAQAEAARLAVVAEHARDMIVIYDAEGVIEWVNPAFTAQTGYAAAEAVGRPIGSFTQDGIDAASVRDARELMEAGGALRAEIIQRRKDGELFWCDASLSPVRVEGGRVVNWISVERDISELKAREAELAEVNAENRRLALVTRHATDSIMLADADGLVEWVNASFTAESGWRLEDVRGRRVRSFVSPDCDPQSLSGLRSAAQEERVFRAQLPVLRPGRTVWHDVIATPIHEGGALRHWVIVQRDIAELKAREQELAQARVAAEAAAEAKSSFLATMSHEIRTPMNGIIGTADLMAETALDADQTRLLRTIAVSSEALLRIINDILDLSKLEAGRMEIEAVPFEPGDLIDLSAQLMRPLAERKGLALDVVLGPGAEAPLRGDAGRMRQILLNLLGNAIKFTEAGRVVLSAEVEPAGADTRRLTLEVADTGIGIEADRLGGVFDAFTQADGTITRRFGGTGLGLSISRRLASAMGGRMTVESRLGEGSRFALVVDLPAARGAGPPMTLIEGPAPVAPTPPLGELAVVRDAAGPGEGPLVLVVEDNATNRFLVERMLRGAGVRCAHAEDGAAGVAACARLDPDVVLMDMSMPVMDGIEATRLIREAERRGGRRPRPILALTANARPSDHERGAEAGVTRFLTKPIRKAELGAAVSEALGPPHEAGLRAAP